VVAVAPTVASEWSEDVEAEALLPQSGRPAGESDLLLAACRTEEPETMAESTAIQAAD